MIAIVKGRYMESAEGYDKKDGTHVEEIILYSGGSTVKVSGISGKNLKECQEVSLLCDVKNGEYGLRCTYIPG